jgi:type II secretory pathway pseudopilin PulG
MSRMKGAMSARRAGPSRRRQETGFSLVEVIVALGVLAGALLSIGSMFILGGRQLKAGRTMTEATVLAHDMMETFDRLSFVSLYTAFGASTADTIWRASSAASGNPITPWQPEISRKLNNGAASFALEPIGGSRFGNAVGIRVTAEVTWSEAGGVQRVTLSTVRF